MRKPFLEYVAENVVVCDGAMGTQLYGKGVFLNRCFDELNLTQPALVQEVHQEYLWSGAEILESNTFGANHVKLEPHGLASKVREINVAGVRLAREAARDQAYVAGSVGPLGIRVEPYGKLSLSEAEHFFAEQISALAEAGADLLSLETFSDLNELHAAIQAARKICDLPLMAQISLGEDGNSMDGMPPETFGAQIERWGAEILGVNCGVGPQLMLESVERISQVVARPLVAQPNAGRPRNFEGRNLYLSSPDYVASYARRFVRAGVRVVGGCCGTTPAHIKSIRDAVRTLRSAPHKPVAVAEPQAAAPVEPVPLERRSRMAHCISHNRFLTSVNVAPPQGSDPRQALDCARLLKEHGVEVIRISDGPRGSATMGALALAILVERELGLEPVLHYTCGDRSLLTMQSELLGAHALGVRNLLLSTGEPIRLGDYADATAVYDVDAVGATHLVTALNNGKDLGGKSIGRPTGFYVGVSADPGAPNLDEEIRLLEFKIEAGAHFILSAPVFQPELLDGFLRRIRHLRIPVIAAIRPLISYHDAEFLNNEVPGTAIPECAMTLLREAGSPDLELQNGINLAREIIITVRGMVQGIEVIAPAGHCDVALQALA